MDDLETSLRSSGSTELGEGHSLLRAALHVALAGVGLDDTPATYLVCNPFFQWTPAAQPFDVPPLPAFLEELKHCWADPRASAHHGRDARNLASMRNAEEHGLVHMPPVDQCIASMILSPVEALKDKAGCLRPQCRIMDSLLSLPTWLILGNFSLCSSSPSHKCYSQSMRGESLVTQTMQHFSCPGLMSRELGRLMFTQVVTRRQVWLALYSALHTLKF